MTDFRIAEVAPLSGEFFRDSLSYFTMRDITPGALVKVPFRKKKIPAILLSLEAPTKMDLRRADFGVRKLDSVYEENFLPEGFMAATKAVAGGSVSNYSQVVSNFLPTSLLKYKEKNTVRAKNKKPDKTPEIPKREFGVELVQAPTEDRISFYKSLIREEFAKSSSIFLCLPTVHEINIFSDVLKKGIEEYTIILGSDLSPKKAGQAWEKIHSENHPVLVIGTPLFFSFITKKFGIIIVEKESSSAYKNTWKPHVDARLFAKELAERYSIRLLFGDTVLRTETIHKKDIEEYQPSLLFKFRFVTRADQKLIDMKNETAQRDAILGDEAAHILKNAAANKENTVLISVRKGLSSYIVCGDCGTVSACDKCGATISLHKTDEGNVYICHRCRGKQGTDKVCKKCGNWNLKMLAFGTERVEEEARAIVGHDRIFRMDSEQVKNFRAGKEMMEKFNSEKGSVLVGTEMVLFYLKEPVENIILVSADTLFSIPDYRMNERLFGHLISAKLLAQNKFLIQTRFAGNPVFEKILRGDVLQFYREEILDRREYSYPPFRTIIKIATEGDKSLVVSEITKLEGRLAKWRPEKFKTDISPTGEKVRGTLLLKIQNTEWENFGRHNGELFEILKSLPAHFAVKVDPENII